MDKTKSEEKIMKDILAGKYKNFYIIYCRKSTDDLNNQKNSLAYQRSENPKFAKKEKLPIADITIPRFITNGIISEKHSSFKEDSDMNFGSNRSIQLRIERPKFYKLVEMLNKKLFKGAIFLSWDRASRNPTDDNVLKKLIKNGIDIRFVMATYDKTSAGALHMDVDGMFSQHHSRVTSEKVTATNKKSRSAGLCTYTAPVGYLNEGNMNWKPLDPVRAPLIKRFFELADEGWSLADIATWAIKQGFTMPPRRERRSREEIESDEDDEDNRPKVSHEIRYTTIQAILGNRFYIGLLKSKTDGFIESNSHDPIVSKELFQRVQEKLLKKNKSKHYDVPLDYPFRNIFTCGVCKRSFTPYPQKGILYCQSKCQTGCKNPFKNFNIKKYVNTHVRKLLENLNFTEEELNKFEERLGKNIGMLEKNRIKDIDDKERQKKKLREDLAYLRANKISLLRAGTYKPEELTAEESKIDDEISKLMTEEQVSEEAMRATIKEVRTISELLKNVTAQWDFADLYEKEEITKIMFSELLVSENRLEYKLTIGMKPFENRFHFTCARERT